MKTYKEYKETISEAKALKNSDVVKILQGPDFGMTEAGGNGEAKLVKGNISVKESHYYAHRAKEQIGSKIKEWKPGGTYHKFFKETYGVDIKIISSDIIETDAKIYGKKTKDAVIEIILTV